MKKIDHVGIAVKDLEASNKLFSVIFGRPPFHMEKVETQQLNVSFFKLEDTKIELLEPIGEGNTVAKFLAKRGEGIHHVAFEVEDIRAEMERMRNEGFEPLTKEPYIGALHKLVCFFHPKDTNGVLIELCQPMG